MDDSQKTEGPWLAYEQYLDFENTLDCLDIKTFTEENKTELLLKPENRQGPPDRGDFLGEYNFSVIITPDTRKKYEYSKRLERVYIQLATELPVHFSWDWSNLSRQYPGDLIIRATLQFADIAETERKPIRCFNHVSTKDVTNRDVPITMLPHVLQSVLKDGEGGVEYCGVSDNPRSWLSVSVKPPMDLPHGVEMFSHTYKFMCKNSCVSGINRRAIEVAFTLETFLGRVLGRQTIGVRVCSCPKRDMGKDEGNCDDDPTPKKPRMSTPSQAMKQSNKVPIIFQNIDLTPHKLNLTILGKRNYETVLHFAMHLMRADANKLHPGTAQSIQSPHDAAIKNILQRLNKSNDTTDTTL